MGLLGVAPSLNMMIWEFGVIRGSQILAIVYLTFMFLGYQMALDDAANYTAARPLMENDIGAFFAVMGSVSVAYVMNYKVWKQGMTSSSDEAAMFSI